MSTQTREPASLHSSFLEKVIPNIESRAQFSHTLDLPAVHTVILRHCNLFELEFLLPAARQQQKTIYVNVDQIDGVHADAHGLAYLAHHFLIHGIISNNTRVLTLGKALGLTTIQRVFAVDSTGLGNSLDAINAEEIDLLDISPALVIPHLTHYTFPLPYIGSGLVSTQPQIQAILQAGAQAVAIHHAHLWL
jgi:glycerol uptake operon antiterminator